MESNSTLGAGTIVHGILGKEQWIWAFYYGYVEQEKRDLRKDDVLHKKTTDHHTNIDVCFSIYQDKRAAYRLKYVRSLISSYSFIDVLLCVG